MSPRSSFLVGRRLVAAPAGPGVPLQVFAALGLCVASAYTIVHVNDWRITAGVFGAAGFAALGLARPTLFVGLLLLVRPLLDDTGGQHVGGLNAAGALGLLLAFVLVVTVVTSKNQFRPRATGAFAVVLALSVLSCVPAYLDFSNSIGSKPVAEVVRLAAILGVYVLAAQLFATPRMLTRLWVIVGLSGVAPAILGIKEMIHGTPKAQGLEISRISGPFTGPNPLGLYMATTALVLIALPRKALPLWIRGVALVPIIVALVATYSRAGWALFVIGFVALAWHKSPALVACGLAMVFALVAFVSPIHDRILPPKTPQQSPLGGGVATPESYTFRLENWSHLLSKASDRPLSGYGLQSTVFVNPLVVRDRTGDISGYTAHNSAVKMLVEGGVPLLIAWIALLAVVLARMRQLAHRDWPFSAQARALFFLWIATIVIGLVTDDPTAVTPMMYGLFGLTGAVEGTFRFLARRSAGAQAIAGAPEHAISH